MTLPVIAASVFLLSSQQAPTPQQKESAKGTIAGVVLRVGTNEPISGVRVSLTRLQAAPTALPAAPGASATPAVPLPAGVTATVSIAQGAGGLPIQQPPIPSVNTDGQGKFIIKDIEPGQYRVLVASNGFARSE